MEPRFNTVADKLLVELYRKFGEQQTTEQKLNILEKELGPIVLHEPQSENYNEIKLACMETEWLQRQGAIDIELR